MLPSAGEGQGEHLGETRDPVEELLNANSEVRD